jgi:hypothetical protein
VIRHPASQFVILSEAKDPLRDSADPSLRSG